MARHGSATAARPGKQSRTTAAQPAPPSAAGSGRRGLALGGAFLLVAVAASAVLSMKHLGGISVPGCGPGSACDQLAATVWGKVPGLTWPTEWPTAFIGLAWFAGLLAAWLAAAGRASGMLRMVTRFGVLLSMGFVVVMLIEAHLCLYCLAAHAGNLGFWIIAERSPRPEAPSRRALGTLGGAAAACMAVLLAVNWQHQRGLAARAEQDRTESTERIIRQAHDSGDASTPVTSGATGSTGATGPRAFAGRWRMGPEASPIRIVIFSDYQCKECNRVEDELRVIMQTRTDVSLSPRHFPFCRPCNPNVSSDMHENACWAARAAETAGILRGSDGFWQMHHWLFDRGGGFTTEVLRTALAEMQYDVDEFIRVMTSDAPLKIVQEDVAAAMEVGLHYTPMVFINGVEMRGWHVPNAVTRTVEEVAATNPPARTAGDDHPPGARQKYLDDWRVQHPRTNPADSSPWARGPAEAAVRVTVWGDYEQGMTAEVDRVIRDEVAAGLPIRFAFRHFPLNEDCNPGTALTRFLLGCRLSFAAEAAGALGGNDAYWAMHDWLLANQARFAPISTEHSARLAEAEKAYGEATSTLDAGDEVNRAPADQARRDAIAASAAARDAALDALLTEAAGTIGVDAPVLLARMAAPETAAAIAEDGNAAKQLGVTGIPFIFVNDRFLPRWRLEGEPILRDILREAAAE
jgi:protein-disulfide isomerase/uncharacterized membrane protein